MADPTPAEYPGIDDETWRKFLIIADHYDTDIGKLVQSTCEVKLDDVGGTWYTPIPELVDFFAADHSFTPTRRRVILHYAAQIPAEGNPFTINELMDRLPTRGKNTWYTRKTLGHALGFARVEEEEWFEVVRETFGKEERWFVGQRQEPYAPLTLDQLQRLYPLTATDRVIISNAVNAGLINITYSVARFMLDCMTTTHRLDWRTGDRHIHYFEEGYDKPTRMQAILIDFMGVNSAEFTYTEVIRKHLVEEGCGHPAVWMTQEALGHFLKRTWQTQESRQGRLSDTYRLERQRGSNTWLWRAIPHDRTTG